MKLTIYLEQSSEGGYTVTVPALPGCISEGESIEEALDHIRDAIQLYLAGTNGNGHSSENILVRELEI